MEFVELIFSEGFGGEKIEGACAWIGEQFVQDRQVVAERLAASRRGDDDGVVACVNFTESLGLMRVKLCNAARCKDFRKSRVDRFGDRLKNRLSRGLMPDGA